MRLRYWDESMTTWLYVKAYLSFFVVFHSNVQYFNVPVSHVCWLGWDHSLNFNQSTYFPISEIHMYTAYSQAFSDSGHYPTFFFTTLCFPRIIFHIEHAFVSSYNIWIFHHWDDFNELPSYQYKQPVARAHGLPLYRYLCMVSSMLLI